MLYIDFIDTGKQVSADQVFDHQIKELVLTNYTLEQFLNISMGPPAFLIHIGQK